MRRFCYRCGALEAEKGPLIRGLCQKCLMKENPLIRAPAEVEVSICSRCKAYLVGGRWHEPSNMGLAPEEAARAAVLSELRFAQLTLAGIQLARPQELGELKLRLEPKTVAGEVLVDVHAEGKVHELQTTPHIEDVRVKAEPKWVTCDVCSLKSAGHHEAVVQVRGKGMTAKALDEIKRTLEKCAAEVGKRDRSAFIAKTEEKEGGIDFYVNPAKLARQMAALLKTKFGAEIKETAKLVGMERGGRRKYKISVLARL